MCVFCLYMWHAAIAPYWACLGSVSWRCLTCLLLPTAGDLWCGLLLGQFWGRNICLSARIMCCQLRDLCACVFAPVVLLLCTVCSSCFVCLFCGV